MSAVQIRPIALKIMFICIKCNKSFKKKSGLISHSKTCEYSKDLYKQIQDLYKQGLPYHAIYKLGFRHRTVDLALKGMSRTTSEAMKRYNELNPHYKHTEETKKKLSSATKGWKSFSYAEEFFKKILIKNNFQEGKDFIREYRFSYYRVDFLFS